MHDSRYSVIGEIDGLEFERRKMEELSVCRTFSSFQSLQDAVETAMRGPVSVLSCSKSVEQANREVAAGEGKFPEILKYKSVRLGCKQLGRADFKSGTVRQSPPKLQCPAHVIAVADRDLGALCIKQVSLSHNHPVTPTASTSGSVPMRQLLPELLDDGHQISDVGLTVTVSYKENGCSEPSVGSSVGHAIGREELVQSSETLTATPDDYDNEDDEEDEDENTEDNDEEEEDEEEEEAEVNEASISGGTCSKSKKALSSSPPRSGSKKRKFSTKHYGRYSPEDLQRAYDAIKKKGLSVYTVARMCGIPKSTLYDRINDRSPFGLGGRPNALKTKILDEDTERQMVEHMKHMEMIGQALSQADILALATKLAHSIGTVASDRVISRSWYKAFLQRWPTLKKSTGSSEKATVETCVFRRPRTMYEYRTGLKSVLDRYRTLSKPQFLYKLEEVLLCAGEPHPRAKMCSNVSVDHKEIMCSVLLCGNALGYSLPPFLIFRKSRKNSHLPGMCMEGASFKQSDGGRLTPSLLKEFLQDHFLPQIVRRTGEQVILLYADSCDLLSTSILEWASSQGTVVFRLPLNQVSPAAPSSLDFGCFEQFAKGFSDACSVHLEEHKKVLTKDFPALVFNAMLGSVTVKNLKAAFCKAGVFPWDSGTVDLTRPLASDVIEKMGRKVQGRNSHRSSKRKKTR
ncbi:uncharacterized protein LOC101860769 [Aplysia californica]|uniref:Uncharacterized protein LOC101860769 n=1 Tax=Aplysia californica TaxID=6500 RepID=A0ABM0K396_APLCA|nr:uncharacterized protein LOC101860769 [Aplysia californica]